MSREPSPKLNFDRAESAEVLERDSGQTGGSASLIFLP